MLCLVFIPTTFNQPAIASPATCSNQVLAFAKSTDRLQLMQMELCYKSINAGSSYDACRSELNAVIAYQHDYIPGNVPQALSRYETCRIDPPVEDISSEAGCSDSTKYSKVGKIRVSGRFVEGGTIRVSGEGYLPKPDEYSFTWFVGGVEVEMDESYYIVQSQDIGKRIKIIMTPLIDCYSQNQTKTFTSEKVKKNFYASSIKFENKLQIKREQSGGRCAKIVNLNPLWNFKGTWREQWYLDGVALDGETGMNFCIEGEENATREAWQIQLKVTLNKPGFKTKTIWSNPLFVRASYPRIASDIEISVPTNKLSKAKLVTITTSLDSGGEKHVSTFSDKVIICPDPDDDEPNADCIIRFNTGFDALLSGVNTSQEITISFPTTLQIKDTVMCGPCTDTHSPQGSFSRRGFTSSLEFPDRPKIFYQEISFLSRSVKGSRAELKYKIPYTVP